MVRVPLNGDNDCQYPPFGCISIDGMINPRFVNRFLFIQEKVRLLNLVSQFLIC